MKFKSSKLYRTKKSAIFDKKSRENYIYVEQFNFKHK